jgi:hypothetical protein
MDGTARYYHHSALLVFWGWAQKHRPRLEKDSTCWVQQAPARAARTTQGMKYILRLAPTLSQSSTRRLRPSWPSYRRPPCLHRTYHMRSCHAMLQQQADAGTAPRRLVSSCMLDMSRARTCLPRLSSDVSLLCGCHSAESLPSCTAADISATTCTPAYM